MPDDVLRVSTTVDLTALTTGLPNAASVVEASTARMNAAFGQVVTSTAQMDAKTTAVAASLSKEAAGAREAQAQIVALQEQITVLNAKLAELEEKLARAPRRAASEFTEARHAIMGTGEMIGVHLPRYITTFLARMEGVQAIMAAAFSAVAIVGLIMIIPELINKIIEATDAMAGWDEHAKKLYEDLVEGNRRAYLESLKLNEEERKLNEIGLTGLLKKQREQENATATLKEYNSNLGMQIRQHQQIADQLEDLKHKFWWGDPTKVLVYNQQIKETTAEYDRQSKTIDELTDKIKGLRFEEDRRRKEVEDQKFTDYMAVASSQLNAVKTVSMASLSFQEQSAREMYELGVITQTQELDSLRSAENQKYEIEKASIARRKALAVEQEKVTGKAAAPELVTLEAQREALEVTHQAKLSSITTSGELERRRTEDSAAMAEVAGARKVADARVSLEIETARELRASRKISITEEQSALRSAEDERFTAEKAALSKELEIARQYPEKNKAQIITLQHDLEAAEIAHKAKLQAIDASSDTARLEESRRLMQEQVRYAQESANIQLETTRFQIDHMLSMHQIGLTQWKIMQEKALNDWYTAEKTALEKELAEAKKVYGEQSVEYKKLVDKLKLLGMQYEKNEEEIAHKLSTIWKQMRSNMENSLIGGFSRVLAGYESFSAAWARLWEQMGEQVATNIMKMLEQMLIAVIMHKSIAKTEVLVSAKKAAASTYEWVAAIPYVGPFLAPPAAAAAFAAVMAFGSFQRGGETGNAETMAYLHPREMVLGEHIATPLKAMLGAVSTMTGRQLPVIAGSAVAALAGGGNVNIPAGMAALHAPGGYGGGPTFRDQFAELRKDIKSTTLNVNKGGPTSVAISLQAWDGESVDRWFRNGGDSLISDSVKRGVRQGRLSARDLVGR